MHGTQKVQDEGKTGLDFHWKWSGWNEVECIKMTVWRKNNMNVTEWQKWDSCLNKRKNLYLLWGKAILEISKIVFPSTVTLNYWDIFHEFCFLWESVFPWKKKKVTILRVFPCLKFIVLLFIITFIFPCCTRNADTWMYRLWLVELIFQFT